MASGFLVLVDGRCFAKRWTFYDEVLRHVAGQLELESPLRAWLLAQLPGPDDDEHLGYGPWLRKSDHAVIERFLDLRELTPENQIHFGDAAILAARHASELRADEFMTKALGKLADLVERQRRGEPPLSRSDWHEIVPSEGRHIGPGWTAA